MIMTENEWVREDFFCMSAFETMLLCVIGGYLVSAVLDVQRLFAHSVAAARTVIGCFFRVQGTWLLDASVSYV